MEEVRYKLTNFEGPLDLLLHLVARRRMSLYDIKINEVIEQYLETIGSLSPDELDGASEFIEMAARLVEMKSLALLPRNDESKELERELVGQLIEYSLCKLAARKLGESSDKFFVAVREPIEISPSLEVDRTGELPRLIFAYTEMLMRSDSPPEPNFELLEEIVTAPVVSVSSRVIRILRAMRKGTVHSVGDLVGASDSRGELVATFLGLLELIKAQRIAVGTDGQLISLRETS